MVTLQTTFIVTFTKTATEAEIAAHMHQVAESGATVVHNYNFGDFRGYATKLPVGVTASDASVAFLHAPIVATLEEDKPVKHC